MRPAIFSFQEPSFVFGSKRKAEYHKEPSHCIVCVDVGDFLFYVVKLSQNENKFDGTLKNLEILNPQRVG